MASVTGTEVPSSPSLWGYGKQDSLSPNGMEAAYSPSSSKQPSHDHKVKHPNNEATAQKRESEEPRRDTAEPAQTGPDAHGTSDPLGSSGSPTHFVVGNISS